MKRGERVAYQQLNTHPMPEVGNINRHVECSGAEAKYKIDEEGDSKRIKISNSRFAVEFDKSTGLLCRYDVDGKSLLGKGGTLRPNFWRAPVDNDFGADTNNKYSVWRHPKMELTAIDVTKDGEVMARYTLPEVKASLSLTYKIFCNGEMSVTQSVSPDETADMPDLFRVGMVMELPNSMDNIEYYGRGPVENYRPSRIAADGHLQKHLRPGFLSLCASARDGHQDRCALVATDLEEWGGDEDRRQ